MSDEMATEVTPNGIRVKDKVRLIKGGKIEMLVGQILKTAFGYMVICHWEEKGKIKSQTFSADVVEKASGD